MSTHSLRVAIALLILAAACLVLLLRNRDAGIEGATDSPLATLDRVATTPAVAPPPPAQRGAHEPPPGMVAAADWINFAVKDAPFAIANYDGTDGDMSLDPEALSALKIGDTVQVKLGEDTVHYVAAIRRDDERGTYVALSTVDTEAGVETGYLAAIYRYPDGTGMVDLNSEVAEFSVKLDAQGRGKFQNLIPLRKKYVQEHGFPTFE